MIDSEIFLWDMHLKHNFQTHEWMASVETPKSLVPYRVQLPTYSAEKAEDAIRGLRRMLTEMAGK